MVESAPSHYTCRDSHETGSCGTIVVMPEAADATWIAQRAKELGFDLCGVVRAEKFAELEQSSEWVAQGYAGEMHYLADPRRSDPERAMAGVRSVIVCALNYNTDHPNSRELTSRSVEDEPRGWISRYAWGRDYHEILREKLEALASEVKVRFSDSCEARVYTDTGPIHERVFAKYAGLGWLGKNTLLLNKELGSFFFLGVILTTLCLQPTLGPLEAPPADLCGKCRRCIDACPTDALIDAYVMDARRCISYLTIELRGQIPEEFRELIGRHVFGCDICQDVCPWNRQAPATMAKEFQPRTLSIEEKPFKEIVQRRTVQDSVPSDRDLSLSDSLFLPRLEWLASMSEEEFQEVFRGSAVKRTKWRGLVRNACIALGNSHVPYGTGAYARVRRILERLAALPEPVIANSANWALSRIQQVRP